jgi:AcrB/AcrD/AcrF family/YtkA-like
VGDRLTYEDLRAAVVEGALLRLRPKVMTVSTVVAGLLPIMWSTSVGAEIMKPLATPVLGGMLSSLLHVLVVTPVIFLWLQARQLGVHAPSGRLSARAVPSWRPWLIATAAVALVAVTVVTWRFTRTGDALSEGSATVVQRVQAGDLQILLVSPTGVLRRGRTAFALEFRTDDGTLVDVGTVRASATMSMPGMVMSGALQTTPSTVPGRYQTTGEFDMAGTWQMSVEWDGPAGRGSVAFEGTVQ